MKALRVDLVHYVRIGGTNVQALAGPSSLDVDVDMDRRVVWVSSGAERLMVPFEAVRCILVEEPVEKKRRAS